MVSRIEDIIAKQANKVTIKPARIGVSMIIDEETGERGYVTYVRIVGVTNDPVPNIMPLELIAGTQLIPSSAKMLEIILDYIAKTNKELSEVVITVKNKLIPTLQGNSKNSKLDISSEDKKKLKKLMDIILQYAEQLKAIMNLIKDTPEIEPIIARRYRFVVIDILTPRLLEKILKYYDIETEVEYEFYKHFIKEYIANHPIIYKLLTKKYKIADPPGFIFDIEK
ncbi:hypothetical protein KKP89_02320 [Methanothermococcus sp. SCGC AD-155-N22]|nr:hypothetical protein [Methanothermococcus sp. SCGC AD-155-N22]